MTVFLDFETGGPESHHPNIQLAAVAMRGSVEAGVFERKIQFNEADCDPEALKINHYTPEKWINAQPEQEVMTDFAKFLDAHKYMTLRAKKSGNYYDIARLAGHNISVFDGPRLRVAMDKALDGAFWPGCWWYPLDTYQRAIWWFTENRLPFPANFQLQTLACYFGITVEGDAHEALSDVRTCVKVAQSLVKVMK